MGRSDAAAFQGLLIRTLRLARVTPDRAECDPILEAGGRAALRLRRGDLPRPRGPRAAWVPGWRGHAPRLGLDEGTTSLVVPPDALGLRVGGRATEHPPEHLERGVHPEPSRPADEARKSNQTHARPEQADRQRPGHSNPDGTRKLRRAAPR